jgi:hypothetical protein
MEVATAAASSFIMPIFVFGGLLINLSAANALISWMQWFSPIRYGFEMIVRAQLYNDPDQLALITQRFGLTLGYWWCALLLVVWWIAYRLLGVVVLKSQVGKFQ